MEISSRARSRFDLPRSCADAVFRDDGVGEGAGDADDGAFLVLGHDSRGYAPEGRRPEQGDPSTSPLT